MAIIISSVALVVSMIALWMAVEARDKSRDEIKTYALTLTEPLHQELTEAKHHIDKLVRNQNRLAKEHVSNTEEINELRRQLTTKMIPQAAPKNKKHPIN